MRTGSPIASDAIFSICGAYADSGATCMPPINRPISTTTATIAMRPGPQERFLASRARRSRSDFLRSKSSCSARCLASASSRARCSASRRSRSRFLRSSSELLLALFLLFAAASPFRPAGGAPLLRAHAARHPGVRARPLRPARALRDRISRAPRARRDPWQCALRLPCGSVAPALPRLCGSPLPWPGTPARPRLRHAARQPDR